MRVHMENKMQQYNRAETNWESLLSEDEYAINADNNKKIVFLSGLQRLAHMAGMTAIEVEHSYISSGVGIFQCVVKIKFGDGTMWSGSADANRANTIEEFFKYPTAVAESRAESRALRKALNIRCLAAEEIGFGDSINLSMIKPTGKISSQVVTAIQKLVEKKFANVDMKTLFKSILSEQRLSEVGVSIFDWNDLTVEEGQKALKFLNEPISDRECRKEVLKGIISGN